MPSRNEAITTAAVKAATAISAGAMQPEASAR